MAKRRLLTKKREKWVQNRTTILKGEVLRNNIVTENRYAQNLLRMTNKMVDTTKREVMKLFKSDESKQFYAMDASLSSQANILLNKLFRSFEEQFKNQGQRYSERMVNEVDKVSVSTLHSSLQKLSGGLSIKTDFLTGDLKEILKATIYENVGLIVTIPQTYLGQVRGIVMRSIIEPNNKGLKGVISDLDKLLDDKSKNIKNKAKNLALDQVRKTYNNLNMGRMKKYGLNKFEWIHSGGGQKPRELHRDVLNGKIFSFDNLPIIEKRTGERGIPGQAINCRCTMLPVIEFDNGIPE